MHEGHVARLQTILLIAASISFLSCTTTVPPKAEFTAASAGSFPAAAWDELLKRYVDDDGRVSYDEVEGSEVERLYAALARSSPANQPERYPTLAARESYYINTYNVLVWKGVLDRLSGQFSVGQGKARFFYLTKYVVGGEAMSLYHLENAVLRSRFQDPRIHMALNCASAGCPKLSRDAYLPEQLDAQLDRETRRFVSEARNVAYDDTSRRLHLSSIFDWYRADFGNSEQSVIEWINRYRAESDRIPATAKIEYVPYDWSLNRRSAPR
jgi:hypothetical protein